MTNKVFNTRSETMLRALLLLSGANRPLNKDEIAALDFICIYGRSCGLLECNLNGDNLFNFAEFSRKRGLMADALAGAVRRNLISVSGGTEGFVYSIGIRGLEIVESVDSSYAKRYLKAAKDVLGKLKNKSGVELLELINQKANKAKDEGNAELLD